MNNDINVMQIVNAYHRKDVIWRRENCIKRRFDAIVFFEKGEIDYYFSSGTVSAKPGDILFLPGNLPYTGKCHSGGAEFFVVDFCCLEENQFENLGAPCSFPVKDYAETQLIFKNIMVQWGKQTASGMLSIKAQLYAILGEFLREQTESSRSVENQILDYIVENISDPSLTVKSICSHFYISDSQLRRNIHRMVGLSPNEYILLLRISMAKKLLSTTSRSVKAISIACGFSSQYYFSRCFSNNVGISPSEYRMRTYT